MSCNGHNTGATNGDARKTNNGCGITQNSDAPVMTDPYKSLAGNIPADNRGGYPQEPKHRLAAQVPTNGPQPKLWLLPQ